ncbi:hypothetical protein [Deinococcus peraridilitoris]|uniref:Uncharacterized protein n=1 Tax=Deinococcus peraridilitoris (strain DSM 19664 / LMG 22246 / CIP 109416 / KR-200) TaxID=937777 RepID=L0A219_DEIPD|nr:hypothetical protein [Deinococcus peraridilitoris]AFZ67891.1 hypothetical protein Deipe_2416 [Deinococcus peraridilitoris DSM 19664]
MPTTRGSYEKIRFQHGDIDSLSGTVNRLLYPFSGLSFCRDVNENLLRCNSSMSSNFSPEELVALLASRNERVCTQARAALAAAGVLARPAVQAGTSHSNPQISRHCRELLPMLPTEASLEARRSGDFWRRLTPRLPGWTLTRRVEMAPR